MWTDLAILGLRGTYSVSDAALQSRMMVLMFTDMVGSVDFKTRLGDAAAARLISRHDAIFRQTIAQTTTAEILQDTGDGFLSRFATVSDAVCFALRFQFAIHNEKWDHGPVQVRVGLHLGEVSELEQIRDGHAKVSGLAVDLTSRIMSLALGNQILMTRAAFDNARQYVREHPSVDGSTGPLPPLSWIAHGSYVFKGSDDPLEIYEVGAVGIAPLREPPNSEKSKRAVRPGEEETLGWRPGAGLEVPGRNGWLLEHRIGEGGFGEVWLGQHRKTKVRRAFKFCYDVDRLRSLKRELTLFRLLREVLGDRPDIARLYEVRLDRAPFFLECEFTELGNLADWSEKLGGMKAVPMALRMDLMIRTAKAVAAAHSVGVLHKDIKPSNILIYEAEDKQARPRLADFGIGVLTDPSQLEGRDITVAGFTDLLAGNESSRTGTRMYAPPETLVGKPFTVQGDIYALGVLLYQVMVGDLERPLASGWEDDIADPVLREDISLCVEGDETQRLASAQQLVERLETLPQRRRARWRRKFAIFSGAGTVVLAILLSITAVVLLRERSLRRVAESAQQQTESINEFLEDMLSSVDPIFYGRDARISDVLKEASDAVGRYQDQPLIQASLHAVIGHTLTRLTKYEEAESHLRDSLRLREKELISPHPDLAESWQYLGDCLWWRGMQARSQQGRSRPLFEESKVNYEKALATRDAIFSRQSVESAESLNGLAAALWRLGLLERDAQPLEQTGAGRVAPSNELMNQARAMVEEALTIRRDILGDQHRLVAASLNNLANFLLEEHNWAGAEANLREALTIVRGLPESKPFDIGRAEHVLGNMLAEHGDQAEAEQLLLSALKNKSVKAEATHESVIVTKQCLARVQYALGHLAEAKTNCEEALKSFEARDPQGRDAKEMRTLLANIMKGLSGESQAAPSSPS